MFPDRHLEPNARNLASVLLQLGKDPDVQEKFREYVREIFPTIYDVRSAPIQQNIVQIEVINRDNAKQEWQPGIRVPLNDSGTGISQVLAILYVVLTAGSPQIIVIDEPNSFLHPGAARKLIGILRRLEHQYIISTHSSEIINATDPDILHLIRWNENASEVETLDRRKNDNQRRLLDELGVRLSDVFGADDVLWVEGLTEERCFPLLLAHQQLFSPATSIVSLIATGDLESKRVRPELALQIYERLSKGNALIPPALGISLDREGRTSGEMEDLKRRSGGVVKFLPRRTYENYLLHPEAIATILRLAMEGEVSPSRNDIEAWMRAHKLDPKYYDRRDGAVPTEENWMSVVNAPKLLKDLFSQLSRTTVEFTKPHHSMELTKCLLAREPGYLEELLGYVSSLVRR